MSNTNRRSFLKQTSLGVTGSVALTLQTKSIHASNSNERVVLGVIGCGGRGSGVARQFAKADGCEVAFVCDPDARRADELAKNLAGMQDHRIPKVVGDLRRILDDRSVDAVPIIGMHLLRFWPVRRTNMSMSKSPVHTMCVKDVSWYKRPVAIIESSNMGLKAAACN